MEPVKKNIVLCSDGTGNQDIKARGTNVFKLYEAVDIQGHKESPNLKQQVAFYDDGVGTSSLLHLKLIGGMFGWGFSQNVRDLYTELIHVYQPGDKIYLFGFSRGAYTVRALSGLIECCGIVDTSKALTESEIENRVSACWKVFKKEAFKRWQLDRKRQQSIPVTNEDAATALRKQLGAIVDETHAPDGKIPIEFVGVWDTVGAVGAPFEGMKDLLNWFFPRRFAELTPSSNVSRARQAISIDDERRTFHPELWNEKGARDENHVRQVWFAGVHSNVGGGYAKHGMSLVALDWMMSEAAACGLRFIDNDSEYVRSHQDVHDKLFDSRAGVAVYYRWQPRNIVELCHKHNMETPRIHVSVFERIANATEGYTPGNIPFMCEVVTTYPTDKMPSRWPSDSDLRKVKEKIGEISKQLSQDSSKASVQSPMDEMGVLICIGKLSYYAFIGLTILFLIWCIPPDFFADCLSQLRVPPRLANWLSLLSRPVTIPPELLASLVALAFIEIWCLARYVDNRLKSEYSKVWCTQRKGLQEILHK